MGRAGGSWDIVFRRWAVVVPKCTRNICAFFSYEITAVLIR